MGLGSPEYAAMLEEFKVQTMEVPSYTRNNVPNIPNVPAELLNSMWIYASNPKRYFSDISQIDDGAVVLVKDSLADARMPEFEEVKSLVLVDYKISEKRRLFSEKGTELYETISSRVPAETFAEVASSLGMESETLDAFSGLNVPEVLRSSTLWDQAMHLEQGKLTRMVISANEGALVYIAEKAIPEIDDTSEDYKTYLEQRSGALSDAMGWARLREITDNSLSALMGPVEE